MYQSKKQVIFWVSQFTNSNITEEQASSVMVKLHKAVEELSVSRICWTLDLNKMIKKNVCHVHCVKQLSNTAASRTIIYTPINASTDQGLC